MAQYVMFQSTPEIEEAIAEGHIVDLTPNKVYECNDEFINDDVDYLLEIVTTDYKFNCIHLNDLSQWQYCDADGNLL